ncbi:glycosyltransferase family 39 protein [Candidatus Beckwithbacteria bacterium]|nr:glycosyltransferase family 39 protein [Candidatus Beckwithbacteria bacterium]
MNKIFKYSLFIFLVFITIFLRLFLVTKSPARLTNDEMSIGYNAYSILKTGKDEWGKSFPLIFKAFGDYKLPAYIYLTVPFLAIFDLNDFSVKVPSIIAGFMIVFYVYKLTLLVFQDKKLAYLAAFICAVSPWGVEISRQAREANLALMFFIMGIYYLLLSQKSDNKKYAIISSLFLALTFYTYVAYRLIIGFLGIYLIFDFFSKKDKFKKYQYNLISFLLFIIPISFYLFNSAGTSRFNAVSIFKDESIAARVTDSMNFCFLKNNAKYFQYMCKLFFNSLIYLFKDFSHNYAASLLPKFLFMEGSPENHLSFLGFGEFFMILLPFYLLGLFRLFKEKANYQNNILKAIFFIAPIPSALTGPPHPLRASILYPFISIIIGLGLIQFYHFIKMMMAKYILTVFFSLIFIFYFLDFYLNYFLIYPLKYDNANFYFDSKNLVSYIKNIENDYEKIYIDKDFADAYIALAFYNKIDPKYLQKNIIRSDQDGIGFTHPVQLGKYYFTGRTLSDLLCYSNTQDLFLTARQENMPNKTFIEFKNFSQVHAQARIYDIEKIKEFYRSNYNNVNYNGSRLAL